MSIQDDMRDAAELMLDEAHRKGAASDELRASAKKLNDIAAAMDAASPVAWASEDGRVVHAHTMDSARKGGGAMLSSMAPYAIPLYAHPANLTGATNG